MAEDRPNRRSVPADDHHLHTEDEPADEAYEAALAAAIEEIADELRSELDPEDAESAIWTLENTDPGEWPSWARRPAVWEKRYGRGRE